MRALRDALPTAKKRRQDAQKKEENPPYPSRERLRAEAEEEPPAVLLTVSDADGTPVRVLAGPTAAGVHRVTWDLRLPAVDLPRPQRARGEADEDVFPPGPTGPYAAPGRYTVSLAQRVNGEVKPLAGPVEFVVRFVGPSPLAATRPRPSVIRPAARGNHRVRAPPRSAGCAERPRTSLLACFCCRARAGRFRGSPECRTAPIRRRSSPTTAPVSYWVSARADPRRG